MSLRRAEKIIRTSAAGLSAFLLAFCVASCFAPVQNSSAEEISDTKTSNFNVAIENPYYISITSSHATASTPISLDYSTSGTNLGNVIATSDTVTTETNSPLNHYLYISTNSASNSLSSSDEANIDVISAGGGDDLASATTLSNNTWGFALSSTTSGLPTNAFDTDYSSATNNSKFAKVPTSGNEILIQKEMGSGLKKDMTINTSTASVYYATKATTELLAGAYTNVIKYTAYAEQPDNTPRQVENITYLQEMTNTICQDMPEADTLGNDIYTLKDSRDQKEYKIAHLADGNCWMVQNLALDGGRTLHAVDSNVTQDRVLPNNTINREFTDTVDNNAYIDSDVESLVDGNGLSYGNFYNYAAATAGTVTPAVNTDATEDICPKGWRLPDIYGDTSYSNILDKYGVPSSSESWSDVSTGAKYFSTLIGAPLYFQPAAWAGGIVAGVAGVGFVAHYWSRTAYADDALKAYLLFFAQGDDNYSFYADRYYFKSDGFSVRCVFGE